MSSDDNARPSTFRVWLLASRPQTLTAAISPVIVSYNLCLSHDPYSNNSLIPPSSLWVYTLQWVSFCICIQLGTNLHNDYADFIKGADNETRVGMARATQKGWLSPAQTCRGCDVCLMLALAIGLPLCHSIGGGGWYGLDPCLFLIVISSIFNAVAYTGGPYPLGYIGLSQISIGYTGLGDLFVFLYFGLVATMTLPYLLLRSSTHSDALWIDVIWELQAAFYVALPMGFLGTAIIVVNNLRDRNTDVHAQKKTLAVRLGATFCRVEYAMLIGGSYIWCWSVLLVEKTFVYRYGLLLLSVPMAIRLLRAVSGGEKDFGELNPYVGGTAKLQLVFCILLSISLRSINKESL